MEISKVLEGNEMMTNPRMLHSILDCIYEAVCVIDESGRVVIWNQSAEDLYKIPQSRILGKDISAFFPDALISQVSKNLLPATNKDHTLDGDFHILANAKPLFIDNQFKGVVSSERDFDEMIRLSNELEKANSRVLFLESEIRKNIIGFENIIGNSVLITDCIKIAKQVAATNVSVMITGDSGTGKEVFARNIHKVSGRKGILVPVNCSAIPDDLFESEMFGYCEGAFTGASKKGKVGIFELAQEGTVFLDEIGDMPLNLQAKLLRVLQEREIMRLGAENSTKIDVRIICATNKDLKAMVQNGSFREDLYYRINVVEIQLPALKDRQEDIPLLIDYFLKQFCEKNNKNIKMMQKEVATLLVAYRWPGNIRELMNVVEYMVVTATGDLIKRENLPRSILEKGIKEVQGEEYPIDLNVAIMELEVKNIKKALKLCQNNKSNAAKLLNIPRATLYHKINEYGIEV